MILYIYIYLYMRILHWIGYGHPSHNRNPYIGIYWPLIVLTMAGNEIAIYGSHCIPSITYCLYINNITDL